VIEGVCDVDVFRKVAGSSYLMLDNIDLPFDSIDAFF